MRKIIVLTFISLDGVMQAPGGPEEDMSGGFKYGGWTAPYGDKALAEVLEEQMKPADLLLGRKTFEIFAGYWPEHESAWSGVNDVTKYAVSGTMKESNWQNTVFLKDTAEIKKLKSTTGSDLQVWGSGNLVQTLLAEDLVDELKLKIFPVTLGAGKRLFGNSAIPAAFTLARGLITPSGVIIADYKRAGDVKTGTVGA